MRSPCGILPFFGILLWTLAFFVLAPGERKSWRWSLALSCLQLAAFALVITEAFSMLGLLSRQPVCIGWSLYCGAGLFIYLRGKLDWRAVKIRGMEFLKSCPLWIGILLLGTGALIFLMELFTPPMNFDVQIYHLPRQIFWLMQGSVEPFTASHSHQISMPVLSEFVGLNLLILSGGDTWHNFVQGVYLLATCGLISLMVESSGGSRRAAWLGILFVILVPVIFFEASNAKNDILLAFLVLLPIAIALLISQERLQATTPHLLIAALSAGLALATKGTAIAYLPAGGLVIVWVYLQKRAWRALLLAAIPGLFLAITPAAPQIARNFQVFGSAAGPNLHHTNQQHGAMDILNVALRNIAGQFTCDSGAWNTALESNTRVLLNSLKLNPDDPATSFEGQPFHLPYYAGLEDLAPAPAQTALILLLPLGLFFTAFRKNSQAIMLFCSGGLSLLLFCFIFRWQPWQGRLLIPAYCFAAPLAGIFLDLLRPRWVPVLLTAWALASLRPHLIFAGQRPLFGEGSIFRNEKTDQMSRMMPGRSNEIQKMVLYLRDSKIRLALIDGGATEIYGLLREIQQQVPTLRLQSGHQSQPGNVDAIIIPARPDAGVAVPPANLKPAAPSGFAPSWIGDYYTIFERLPVEKPPIMAASFAGFEANPAFTEIWKQGSSLKKSGRMASANSILLTAQQNGPLLIHLEGTGKNGTTISLQSGEQTIQKTIQDGRFEIQEVLTQNGDILLKTSADGVFWRKIKFTPAWENPTR